MKKTILFGLAILLFIACQNQPQRYFETSAEIDATLKGIEAYENQDWTTWKANFADSAKIFHNTHKGASPDETMENMKNMLSNIDSYGFNKENDVSEMVVDQEGKKWVNYWGSWSGTTKITGAKVTIPVHLTLQFVDGKIVQEYAYYDTAPLNEAFAAMAATQESATEAELEASSEN